MLCFLVEEIVNLPHHADAPLVARPLELWEQVQVTHSSRALRFWSSVILLHFNLHTAHHLFPWLPWYDLPRANRELTRLFPLQVRELPGELCWNRRRRRVAFRVVFSAFFVRRGARA
jgi:fatty acid desaturase